MKLTKEQFQQSINDINRVIKRTKKGPAFARAMQQVSDKQIHTLITVKKIISRLKK